MKYNLFVARSPLQLTNAIEAKYYFKTKNNVLVLYYSEMNKNAE